MDGGRDGWMDGWMDGLMIDDRHNYLISWSLAHHFTVTIVARQINS